MGKASSKIVEKLFVKVRSIYFSYLTLQAQEILMIVVHPGAVKLWSFCVLIQRKNVGK